MQNFYFLNDEVRPRCPKLGYITQLHIRIISVIQGVELGRHIGKAKSHIFDQNYNIHHIFIIYDNKIL